MSERSWTNIDKSTWGQGPWQDEPDKVQWYDPETGMACLAKRHQTAGHWCGYVGVEPGHPYYGVGYNQCPRECGDSLCDHRPDMSLEVHGGLTFADKCSPGESEADGICHVPEPGRTDDVWWLGFDCAHAWDVSPGTQARMPDWPVSGDEHYRSLSYVRSQVASLAQQLAAVAR